MYIVPKINYSKRRKGRAIPDQSLTIQEIVKRYVRGIPVDVLQRTPVYSDQEDHDLEKISRMDFGEKAAYAAQQAEQAKQLRNELNEKEAEHREAQERAASEKAARLAKRRKADDEGRTQKSIVVP